MNFQQFSDLFGPKYIETNDILGATPEFKEAICQI